MPRPHAPVSEGRGLRLFNAVGVLLLFVVCMAQWHSIHWRDARLQALEAARLELSSALRGATNDLAQLQVERAALEGLNATNARRATVAESRVAELEHGLHEGVASQKALQDQLVVWRKGVEERDQRLKTLSEQHLSLVAERDAAIRRFNELVRQHNDVVALLEKVRSQSASKQASP